MQRLAHVETVLLETCTDPSQSAVPGSEAIGLGVFALVGLLAGAHCLGMCGPLVTVYSDRLGSDRNRDMLTLRQVRQHALFNLGRTASYGLIGGIAGLAGSLVFVETRHLTVVAREVHAIMGLVVGLAIVGIGITYLHRGAVGAPRLSVPFLSTPAARLQRGMLARVDRWVEGPRIVGLGAVHGLLPCPIIYPAYLYAFVQATPSGGAAALIVLGLGTVPSLFLYGTLFGSLSPSTRQRLHRGLGAAFVLLGYIPLQHGLAAMGLPLPHPPIPYYSPL